MNVQTPLANIIDKAGDKSTYNQYAIKILSNPYILAYIMKGTIPECQNMSILEIIATIDGKPEIRKEPVHPDEVASEITGTKNEDIVLTQYPRFFFMIKYSFIIVYLL